MGQIDAPPSPRAVEGKTTPVRDRVKGAEKFFGTYKLLLRENVDKKDLNIIG